jgi:hypothetical protein
MHIPLCLICHKDGGFGFGQRRRRVGDVDIFRGFVEWKTIGWMILCFRVSSWCVQFLLDVVSTYIYKSNSRSYSYVFFLIPPKICGKILGVLHVGSPGVLPILHKT